MNLDQVKDKLKKLFAVAENDASADGEVENAMAAASALMNAHQITRDDITEDDNGEVDVSKLEYGRHDRYSRYSSLTAWETIICHFIKEFVPGCGYYIEKSVERRNAHGMASGGKATKITFYGPDADARFCCDIFDEVVYFIAAASKLRFGSALARGAAASYAEGFARGLYDANHKEQAKLTQASKSDSTALVVVNRSLAVRKASKTWLATEHGVRLGRARSARSAAHKSTSAYNQGKEDGANYNVGSTRKAGYLE